MPPGAGGVAAKPSGRSPVDISPPRTWEQFLETMPLPVALTLLTGVNALIAAAGGAFAALFVTPRTMRRIADQQADVGRAGIAVAAQTASAAAESAKAAARNAEVAAQNSHNVGIHEVARLRQEWINAVRDELALLHSNMMNWRPLEAGATADETAQHSSRVIATNSRLAKIRLLLNPGEVASQNVLAILGKLNTSGISTPQRLFLCRWFIRWSQIVLKTEWDRVRNELQGQPTASSYRRAGRR